MLFNKDEFQILIAGDKELFRSLLDLYSEDWPLVMDKVREGIERNDPAMVEQYGHRIKGNLRNFYANELAELAFSIEEAGRVGQIDNLETTIAKLQAGLKDLELELQTYYGDF